MVLLMLLKKPRLLQEDHEGPPVIDGRRHQPSDAENAADEQAWIVVNPNERKQQSTFQESNSKRPILDETFDNPYILSAGVNFAATPTAGPPGTNATRGPLRRFVVWSQDFRVGPVAALKHLLTPLGVVFIDQSFSPLCRVTRTCARNLDAISALKMWHLSDVFARDFHRAYANDARLAAVDAFLCVYPPSQCELFAAFNKSVILVIDDRYELGRAAPSRWITWNKHIARIAADPKNAVIVTNHYDREYVQYFTMMAPPRIPYHCGYVDVSYNPQRSQFLLMPSAHRFFEHILLRDIASISEDLKLDVSLQRASLSYGHRFRLTDLARHWGLVYVPHQTSYLALTEHYRAGIPMFVPSVHLLTDWHQRHAVVAGKSRVASQRAKRDGSVIKGAISLPDPNDDTRRASVAYWLHHADFYQWPHVIQFKSIEDLVRKLTTITITELRNISRLMREHSAQEQMTITKDWMSTLNRIILVQDRTRTEQNRTEQ